VQGGFVLARGAQEVEVPAQGEAKAHQEAAAGTSRGGGGTTRGDATTSQGKQEGGATRGDTTTRRHVKRWWRVKRLQHDEKPHDNQPGKREATAHQEILTHQEGERQRDYRQHDNQPGQTRGICL
jgi:hypothetical protein